MAGTGHAGLHGIRFERCTSTNARNHMAAILGGILAASLSVSSTASAQSKKIDADPSYEEHTGFVVNHEDFKLAYDDGFKTLFGGFPTNSEQYQDLKSLQTTLDDRPTNRKYVRFIRYYGDAPVHLLRNKAFLPGPSDDPIKPAEVLADFDAACNNNPRCIGIDRYDQENLDVALLVIAARTLVVGDSSTLGLSLVTFTETMLMPSGTLSLSARQDRAPTMQTGQSYQVNPLDPSTIVGDVAAAAEDAGQNGTLGRLWWWVTPTGSQGSIYDDLAWQYKRAQLMVPDYDDPNDICTRPDGAGVTDCEKLKNPRGFAGLPSGSWVGFTYRSTGVRVRASGQPGGNGGKGLEGQFNKDADSIQCSDFCADKVCEQTYRRDDPNSGCTLVCNPSPFADGQRGGQPGYGGEPGFVRISATTHVAPCWDWDPAKLAAPNGADALDRRCSDGLPNDGDATLIDCDAPACYGDPNVLVCGSKPIYPQVPSWYSQITKHLPFFTSYPIVPATGQSLTNEGSGRQTASVVSRLSSETFVFGEASSPTSAPALSLDRVSPARNQGPIALAELTIPETLLGLDTPPPTPNELASALTRANVEALARCGPSQKCDKQMVSLVETLTQPDSWERLRKFRMDALRDGASRTAPLSVIQVIRGSKLIETLAVIDHYATPFGLPPGPGKDQGPGQGTIPPYLCFDDSGFGVESKHGASGLPGEGGDDGPAFSYCLGAVPNLDYMCHIVPLAPTTDGGGVGSFYYWPRMYGIKVVCTRDDFDAWFTGMPGQTAPADYWQWWPTPTTVPLQPGSSCTTEDTEPKGVVIRESNHQCAAQPSCSSPLLHDAVNVKCLSQPGDPGESKFRNIHFIRVRLLWNNGVLT